MLPIVFAILPSIRRLWMCAARAAVVFLFMCLEARCFNRLAEPGHRPCGSDAGLWPLIVKDGPLFIADFAIEEPLAAEELEVCPKVLQDDRVI